MLRHARACAHLHQHAAALQSWFALCWRFPDRCAALETSGDHELRQQWIDFLALDPELPEQSFPAWLLLRKPALTGLLPDPGAEAACPDSYRTMYRLFPRRSVPHNVAGKAHEIQASTEISDFA